MSKSRKSTIEVQGAAITVLSQKEQTSSALPTSHASRMPTAPTTLSATGSETATP